MPALEAIKEFILAEPNSATAAIALSFLFRAFNVLLRSQLGNVFDPHSYQNQRFGRGDGLLVGFWVNVNSLEESERRLCNLDDDKLLKWRDSYVSILNIVPFAVSQRPIRATNNAYRAVGSNHWSSCTHRSYAPRYQ